MKFIFTFSLVLILLSSAKGQESLFDKLKYDRELLAYKHCQIVLHEKTMSKYFVIPKNIATLGYKNGKALLPDSLKVVLKDNGVQHAGELIDLMTEQQNHLMAFFAKHPEIKKLPPTEQRELFMKLISN